tara:strand:- start:48 stop:458 length:411 start_codon:yes stop_codon:yes gene_type:complete
LNKNISDKDKKDWQKFIESKEKLYNKDLTQKKKNFNKSVSIDLHGYTLPEANENVKKIIIDCYNTGVKKILVVTGKGLHSKNEKDPYVSKDLSILKYSVPDFIKKNMELNNLIKEIKEASVEDGGSGAFYIYLKKK